MKTVAVDTETTGLNPYKGARAFAISLATRGYKNKIETIYIDFPVDALTRKVTYKCNSFEYEVLKKYLYSDLVRKVFHNAKFDIKMLRLIGLEVNGPIDDTLLMARSCFTLEPSYGLKPLAKKYVDIPVDDETELKSLVIKARNSAKKLKANLGSVPEEDYWLPKLIFSSDVCKKYAVNDAIRTLKLYEFYNEGLDQLEVRKSYQKEIELLPILLKMEDRGVRFHYEKNLEEIDKYTKIVQTLQKDLHNTFGEINLNSPKQLLPALNKINIPIDSTAADVLEEHEHIPIVKSLLNYRGYVRGVGFLKEYMESATIDNVVTIDDFPKLKCYAIHTNFNQGNARTWRLSCNDPNLQQNPNPKTSEALVSGRTVFGPREGYVWYCFDYSGQELRIFASGGNVTSILEAFKTGRDIHNEVRESIPELTTFEKGVGRKYAKNVTFCKIFGGGPGALVKYIGKPKDYCSVIIKKYDKQFPEIVGAIKRFERQGRREGFIVNAYGRKINIDSDAAYKACNYYVQSSACDLMKSGMIKVNSFIQQSKLDAHLLLSIHDEIIVEVKKEHAYKDFIVKIKALMENHEGAFNIDMPVDVAKTSTFWADKSEEGLEWLNGKETPKKKFVFKKKVI